MAVFALLPRLRRWCTPVLATLLAASALQAAAQADPPERIARFDLIEGSAQHQTGADNQTRPADTGWPLIAGDRVWTDTGSRAEIDSGGMLLRLDGASVLEFTALDPQTTQLKLTQGTLGVQLRAAQPGQRYEIDTPNLAFVITRPGRYRIDVDPGQGLTRVSAVEPGAAGVVYGEKGESLPLTGPQRRDFVGRALSSPGLLAAVVAGDDFDRWSEQRARLDAASVSARYVSREMPGYRMLDGQGDWQNDGTYGTVWYPTGVAADWAPYRYGRWEWVQPWGWTWMDDAPWGFAPFHYGRWTQISSRWAWVPGPANIRPTYAPALVGFVGNQIETGTILLGNGRPGVAWFPLAPGEAWRPGYRASERYLGNINRGGDLRGNVAAAAASYRPGAVSGIGADDFGRRWGERRRMEAVSAEELARARMVQAPIFRPGAGYGSPGQVGLPPQVPQGVYGASGGALADQVRQQQWAQQQHQREVQQYRDNQQVEQMRRANERFQPGFSQRQAEDQQRAQQAYKEQVRIQQQNHERRDQFRMEQNQREQAVQRMEQQQRQQQMQQQQFQVQQQQFQVQQQQQQQQQMQERQGQAQLQQQIRQHQDQQRQQMQQQRESMQQRMQPNRGMEAPRQRFEVRPGG